MHRDGVLEAIRPLDCEWEISPSGHHVCRLCGWTYHNRDGTPRTPTGPLRRNCPTKVPPPALPWGLGDHVRMLLEALGITAERVTWLLRLCRIIPPDGWCPCEENATWLNELGWRLLFLITKRSCR